MQSPQSFQGRPTVENIVLLASGAQTATGTGTAITLDGFEVLTVQCELTAAATEANDTLDVFLQTTVDGSTWLDAIHFTQMLGNGGAKRFVAKISASLALTEYETATSLGAAAVRNLIGSQWRVRWAIADPTGSNASFTFSVKANAT